MDRLDEIFARCETATPGPWETVNKGNSIGSNSVVSIMYGDGPKIDVCSGAYLNANNADFIANARKDILYLLSEVERLKKHAETLRLDYVDLLASAEKAEAERDIYKAALQIPHDGKVEEENQWIPVSERLPDTSLDEDGEPPQYSVMIEGAKIPTQLYIDKDERWFDWAYDNTFHYYEVTHWRPLPQPPKGE